MYIYLFHYTKAVKKETLLSMCASQGALCGKLYFELNVCEYIYILDILITELVNAFVKWFLHCLAIQCTAALSASRQCKYHTFDQTCWYLNESPFYEEFEYGIILILATCMQKSGISME